MYPLLDDFISLFYPRLCAGCDVPLVRGEQTICISCLADLPITGFEHLIENPIAELFWGRVKINHATSYCRFDKGGHLQHLMHQLKYKGNKEVGEKLGTIFGRNLVKSNLYKGVELIIPVPLHPKRERQRGYNQSAEIGKGVAHSMDVPMILKNLIRNRNTMTQTSKGRFERWENVKEMFSVVQPELIAGKHLLLIDDVVTTGATLEACAQVLTAVKGTTVSIATLAFA